VIDFPLDDKLLEYDFNPSQPICDEPKDTRNQSITYRAYKDCLICLKIIGRRLKGYNSNDMSKFEFPSEYYYLLDSDSFL